jgi:2-iminobutanoate/2-iminopropanoate deaminase
MMRTVVRSAALLLLSSLCAFASEKRIIYPKEFASGKPYSPGVVVSGTLYVSGQLGQDPKTGKLAPDFASEVRQCFKNLQLILRDARMKWDDVVSVQVFLTDISQFSEMNEIYLTYFKELRPARVTVAVSALAGSAHIEISAVAHNDRADFHPMREEPH